MAQIFLVDGDDFQAMNEAWDAWVPEGAAPARATVVGVKLADPGWKVEIVVTAALP
jgi:enamine deaminase RidA (YjgF/YER057c/UK114 family)